MTPAAALTNRIRESTSRLGARLFNMHVGKFWAGQVVKTLPDGCIVLKNPRIVNVGVQGMSDLIGPTPYVVTAEDVGKTVAIYTVCEIKAGSDTIRPGQMEFIEMVRRMGGRGGIARSVQEAEGICAEPPGRSERNV